MSVAAQTTFARRDPAATARVSPDRRRFRRVHVDLLGRFMNAQRQEYPCRIYDISVGGAALLTQSPPPVAQGERVIAYFDHIGRIEGDVARVLDGGFAMNLVASLHKREKLCATLTWLVNRNELSGVEGRRHERAVPANDSAELKLDEGVSITCQIIDVSISGASIVTDARPPLGHSVTLGKLRARVVRHHETGIALEFIDVQNPLALRRYFG